VADLDNQIRAALTTQLQLRSAHFARRKVPLGDRRREALKAGGLRIAAEIYRWLATK
jgi:hypothetical protein